MKRSVLLQMAISILASHPTEEKILFTTDGMPFFNVSHANGHGTTLKDRTLITIARSEATQENLDAALVEEGPIETEAIGGTKPVAKKAAKPKK